MTMDPATWPGHAQDLAGRAAFVLLVAAWILIRAAYAKGTAVAGARSVRRERDALDRALIACTGLSVLLAGAHFVAFSPAQVTHVPFSDAARLGGSLLALAALGLFWWSHAALGSNWSIGLAVRDRHTLVERGPYRLVRHPMYLAMLLFELGLGLLASDAALLLLAPAPFVMLVLRRLPREEALMREHLGAAYAAYAARTKRLVPWLF